MLNKRKIKNVIALALLTWTIVVLSPDIHARPLTQYYLSSMENETSIDGDAYWARGNINRAIAAWKKEVSTSDERILKTTEIETRLKIAWGYISLGQFYPAITELERIIALTPSDRQTLALTRKRLGNAYSGLGKFDKAIFNYQESLKQKKSLSTTNSLVEALIAREKYNRLIAESSRQINSKGSNAIRYRTQAEKDRNAALKYAEAALSLSDRTNLSSVRALINWTNISGQNLSLQQLYKGKKILSNIEPSRNLVFTILNWADIDKEHKALWLQRALDVASAIDDPYLKSYAFLELGYLEEQLGNLTKALDYAQSSQIMAQSEFAYDSLFRAQQLAGRIYQTKGERTAAIDAYRQAIASLGRLRQDSVTISIEQRKNFETEVEPIYRSALKLLLDRPQTKKSDLIEAIAIFDKLRLAQLQNYFGDNCFEIVKQKSANKNNPANENTAIINSIILENKTFFILQLPNGRLVKSEVKVSEAELVKQASEWTKNLNNRATNEYRTRSRLFYDYIIKPFESHLAANNLTTLIFVHDGILRNLPMAALFDGQQFLVQKWASVSSIGLNLTPTYTKPEKTKAIAFGLELAIAGWSPLPNVASEIQNIQNIIGGNKFLNSQFTADNLYQQLLQEKYDVVHLATHGYFGGTVETSFLLAYDQKISALQLENVLLSSRQIPELLVLSACETALTSDRSLLGLAGIAARSGVSSTLGTFWQVQDDEQSQTIEAFYSYWRQPKYNKATALQKVQIEEIKKYDNAHPEKWAALTLIGSNR